MIAVLALNLNKLLGQAMSYLQAAANNQLLLHTLNQPNTVTWQLLATEGLSVKLADWLSDILLRVSKFSSQSLFLPKVLTAGCCQK